MFWLPQRCWPFLLATLQRNALPTLNFQRLHNKAKMFKKRDNDFPFVHVQDLSHLQELVSAPGKVFIYKHSTRCSVSLFAMKRLLLVAPAADETWVYVDVVGQRPISMALAEALDVWHESPQLILLKDGKVLDHTSHSGVTEDTVDRWRSAHFESANA